MAVLLSLISAARQIFAQARSSNAMRSCLAYFGAAIASHVLPPTQVRHTKENQEYSRHPANPTASFVLSLTETVPIAA